MDRHSLILLDLDGTLTDPGLGITNSVAYALRKMGLVPPERQELYRFIGPPLMDSFQVFCGLSQKQALEAIDCYREYYRVTGIYENRVYDGIPALLEKLSRAGKRLAVATSKPEVFAHQVLEHFDLSHYFSYVAGGNLDGSRTVKAEVIQYALDACGAKPADGVMVGDRKHDILGAAAWGMASVGVLYGYGDRRELEAAGAGQIAETVEDLSKILLEQ